MGGIAAPDHGLQASLSGLPLLRVVLGERVVQQRPHQAGDELPAPERLIMWFTSRVVEHAVALPASRADAVEAFEVRLAVSHQAQRVGGVGSAPGS
jgi:hypothetical protein